MPERMWNAKLNITWEQMVYWHRCDHGVRNMRYSISRDEFYCRKCKPEYGTTLELARTIKREKEQSNGD